MRRLATAVFGTIALVVAAATARAIENSSWYTNGNLVIDVRASGLPRFTAVGPFTSASARVFTDDVSFEFGPLAFTSGLTATATILDPGPAAFEPASFTNTVAKFNVDFGSAPSGLDFPTLMEDFTLNMVENLLETPVVFIPTIATTMTAANFDGIQLFQPTLKAAGRLQAFSNFTKIKGGFTISCRGKTFVKGDLKKPLGRSTKITIRSVIINPKSPY